MSTPTTSTLATVAAIERSTVTPRRVATTHPPRQPSTPAHDGIDVGVRDLIAVSLVRSPAMSHCERYLQMQVAESLYSVRKPGSILRASNKRGGSQRNDEG